MGIFRHPREMTCSSGICDDNEQESRSDTEQHWGIFVISGLLPWSAVCCYLMGHKQCKHQDFQGPGEYVQNVVYREVLEM